MAEDKTIQEIRREMGEVFKKKAALGVGYKLADPSDSPYLQQELDQIDRSLTLSAADFAIRINTR